MSNDIPWNKNKKNQFFNAIFLMYNLLKKLKSFFGELPKYIMQYLDTAWENKYIFTFSRKLEVRSNN